MLHLPGNPIYLSKRSPRFPVVVWLLACIFLDPLDPPKAFFAQRERYKVREPMCGSLAEAGGRANESLDLAR